MRGVFVSGTDTNVGKTIVSAILMLSLREDRNVRYWKPIQTGIETDDDLRTVVELAGCFPNEIISAGYRFKRPLSPHLAAAYAGESIDVRTTIDLIDSSSDEPFWIVEGAGGVLVPLNEREMMLDLIAQLGLPVLITARPTLGTINHTLLTVEALFRRRIPIAGVVFNGGSNDENLKAIEHFGHTKVIAQIPQFTVPISDGLQTWAAENSRSFKEL